MGCGYKRKSKSKLTVPLTINKPINDINKDNNDKIKKHD